MDLVSQTPRPRGRGRPLVAEFFSNDNTLAIAMLFALKRRLSKLLIAAEIPCGSLQKTREGCGCLKFLAGKGFSGKFRRCWKNFPIFRQHEMLSLPRSGHFPARKTAAGNWPHLRERCWIFCSETATAFLSSSDHLRFKKLLAIAVAMPWFCPPPTRDPYTHDSK